MNEHERLKLKVCLVGDQGVGKSSLIRRFVLNAFDDHYLATVGTKVSKKLMWITIPGNGVTIEVDMQVWDIMGEPDFRGALRASYFAGAQGILAACDVTRRATLEGILSWVDLADEVTVNPAWCVVGNKADLRDKAAFGEDELARLAGSLGSPHMLTSARTGENVERAFQALTRSIFVGMRRTGLASLP
ncbi:MAG: hypothetical protein A3K66_06260 [Euryarchaeota archaeon RBG_16_67_27]|nr:MAG: hypothetical protein A3K66_06260 [Euryarchaeota archaeon RBG_16_67_27]